MQSMEFLAIAGAIGVIAIGWYLYFRRMDRKPDLPRSLESPEAAKTTSSSPQAVSVTSSGQPLVPPVEKETTAAPTVSYAFVDLETTGLDRENDRIIEICVCIVTPGASSHDAKNSLINPGRPLSPFITELTGITDEMLKDKEGEEALHEFFDFIGDHPVYAYNAEFDMGFLKAAAGRLGRSFNNQSVCVLERLRREHPDMRSYKLGDACDAFGIKVREDAHRAFGDVERTIFLWDAINRGKHPDSSAPRPDPNALEYGLYGHYTQEGALFYVWTARDGEPTSPNSDYVWSEYVSNHLQGRYEVRSIRSGLTRDHAIGLKDQFLSKHASTLVNRANPYRKPLRESQEHYERLKASSTDHRRKGKELESSDPQASIDHYIAALSELNTYAEIVIEEGLFGQFMQEMNRQSHGGEAIKILDRISLVLCKVKRFEEADAIAKEVFQKYPMASATKTSDAILKRIRRGLKVTQEA